MTIRSTMILLALPLFLALALVNGALLYQQESSGMKQALNAQALAAAVTSANFISSMKVPDRQLHNPQRIREIRQAADRIEDLDGLFLIGPGQSVIVLAPSADRWMPRVPQASRQSHLAPRITDIAGHRFAVASAAAGSGILVVARIDAEPTYARIALMQREILLIALVTALTAIALGWFVARRIVRELNANRDAIKAIGTGRGRVDGNRLAIRETHDLADAIRLMEASEARTAERSCLVLDRMDHERTVASAVSASQEALFKPLVRSAAGCDVAVRLFGKAPPGSFFALCAADSHATIVLGRCVAAKDEDALALAFAARQFLEATLSAMSPEACLALARKAFAIEQLQAAAWHDGDEAARHTHLIALAADEAVARAGAYLDRNRDAAPAALLDAVEILVEPDGSFAAFRRS